MSIDVGIDGDTATLAVTGELDLAGAPYLSHQLQAVIERGAAVVRVDLAGLEFIDSQGVGVLVRAYRDLGDRLQITGATRSVRRVFDVTGLTHLLGES